MQRSGFKQGIQGALQEGRNCSSCRKKRKKNRSLDIFDFILIAVRGEKGTLLVHEGTSFVIFFLRLHREGELAVRLTSQPYIFPYCFEKTKGNIVVFSHVFSQHQIYCTGKRVPIWARLTACTWHVPSLTSRCISVCVIQIVLVIWTGEGRRDFGD